MPIGKIGKAVPRNVTIGTPNVSEAPGGLRRFFRFSQLAVGDAGTSRKIEDIWATFLQEVEDLGVPPEARSRMESLGAKTILGRGGLPKSVVSAIGSKESLAAVKETIKVARAATGGLSDKLLETEWSALLKRFAGDPQFADANGKRILAELQAINPKIVARVGAGQTLSALSRRGQDPIVTRLFNKALRRPGSAILPEGIESVLRDISGGKLPKVTAATTRALAKGGVKGLGIGRAAVGLLGKTGLGLAGVGILGAFEISRAKDILGRGGRAKKLALQGFQGLGPSSSVDFLRDIVGKQEAVARRKVTMQKFEPELFQEVVRVLSDMGPSQNTLTSTERRIGADEQVGATRRGRPAEDVQFLLDQLFNQMGQGAG